MKKYCLDSFLPAIIGQGFHASIPLPLSSYRYVSKVTAALLSVLRTNGR